MYLLKGFLASNMPHLLAMYVLENVKNKGYRLQLDRIVGSSGFCNSM